jgi:hypothetical protein
MDDGKWMNNVKRIVLEDQKDKGRFSVGDFQFVVLKELSLYE